MFQLLSSGTSLTGATLTITGLVPPQDNDSHGYDITWTVKEAVDDHVPA
jgi:hypothetical protein